MACQNYHHQKILLYEEMETSQRARMSAWPLFNDQKCLVDNFFHACPLLLK